MDLVIQNQVIVELKCAEKITRVHEAQLLTYLKLAEVKVGLILNFHEPLLTDGIKRLVV
jgi:GxxExxY protein